MNEDLKNLTKTLHPLERKVLPFLKISNNLKELTKKTNLKEVEVMRALQWLENKHILKLKKSLKEIITLDKNGEIYIKKGLPEKNFLKVLEKELTLEEIKNKSNLNENELNIALGILKSKAAIEMKKDKQLKVKITEQGKKFLEKDSLEEQFLKSLPLNSEELTKEQGYAYSELKKRKKIIKTKLEKTWSIELTNLGENLTEVKIQTNLLDTLTPKILKEGSWKNKEFRRYDVKINVPKISGGRKHFVNEAKSHIKRIWLDMGFKEMKGNLIQSSFWNFDALFVPQDHPAREMQDTFFVSYKKDIDKKEFIQKVKKSHEENWKYKWNLKDAEKLVLRTHTTVLSAKTLASLKKEDLPAKFFAIGKNFRNEAVDWKHLFELIQVEGIVVDENANFRNLIGYLKEFFGKMGFTKIRIRPAYFPYTSCSAEVDVYNPIKKKWVELGGAGIFRPEVTKPLLGKEIPVLAWGLGLERIIMDYYQIKDIRELYKNDLKQLKEIKSWFV